MAENSKVEVYANTSLNNNSVLNSINANTKRMEAERDRAKEQHTIRQAESNKIALEIKNKTDDSTSIRAQFSARYTSRMVWIFLTAVFTLLCLAAVISAGYVFYKLNKPIYTLEELRRRIKFHRTKINGKKWSLNNSIQLSIYFWRKFIIWVLVTFLSAFLFALVTFWYEERYMFVVLPMLEQTLKPAGEISIGWINFFHVCGFFASIFLVAASCAIFFSAIELDNNEKADDDKKLEEYASLMKYLRLLLYVGTLMLFVGILRMGYLMQWHLAFVSNSTADSLYTLLNNYSTSSMSVQGGFYTLLLAAIYLPTALWIKNKALKLKFNNDQNLPASYDERQTILQREGLVLSYSEFIPRILVIVSPLLAVPISKWLEFLSVK